MYVDMLHAAIAGEDLVEICKKAGACVVVYVCIGPLHNTPCDGRASMINHAEALSRAPSSYTNAHTHIHTGAQVGINVPRMLQMTRQDPMTACYLDSSFPSLLYYATKYGPLDPEQALLRSTNAGGENVARGACVFLFLFTFFWFTERAGASPRVIPQTVCV